MSKTAIDVRTIGNDKIWDYKGDTFTAKVFVPNNDLPGQIINFGYKAPYLLVFAENRLNDDEAVVFAKNSGLDKIAASYDSSVVFVYPTCEGGWKNATVELYKELIASSKIGPMYHDGVLDDIDFFKVRETQWLIRGAIFRAYLYGYGESADYIAKNLMEKIDGQYLWGPGEITPAVVSLEKLNVVPNPKRSDIPVISIGNADEINAVLEEKCEHLLVKDEAEYEKDFKEFILPYKRWCGTLVAESDLAAMGVAEEYGVETVKTSPDNNGSSKGTDTHEVGYFAWYNKEVIEKAKAENKKVPTVMVHHGGGDSAYHISYVSGWWEIAHKYDFLMIAVENHLEVSATETIELIEKLKDKYPIDENRLYATGFSMGGCKTWDLFQEYPEKFAAMAPMDATFDVGHNLYDQVSPRLNKEVAVPVFYAGGEITPLPELPFQAQKCLDRIEYLFEVNRAKSKYEAKFEDVANWSNKIWGIDGDRVEKIFDESRNSTLTINHFKCDDDVEKIALASISEQGHECRQHTCEHAWLFMSKFSK